MENQHAYVHLKGKHAATWRRMLQTEFLPIESPLPDQMDGGEYGQLVFLNIDAARLTPQQRTRLVDWITQHGDNPNRTEIEADVLANKATYLLDTDDESEIVFSIPNPLN